MPFDWGKSDHSIHGTIICCFGILDTILCKLFVALCHQHSGGDSNGYSGRIVCYICSITYDNRLYSGQMQRLDWILLMFRRPLLYLTESLRISVIEFSSVCGFIDRCKGILLNHWESGHSNYIYQRVFIAEAQERLRND